MVTLCCDKGQCIRIFPPNTFSCVTSYGFKKNISIENCYTLGDAFGDWFNLCLNPQQNHIISASLRKYARSITLYSLKMEQLWIIFHTNSISVCIMSQSQMYFWFCCIPSYYPSLDVVCRTSRKSG